MRQLLLILLVVCPILVMLKCNACVAADIEAIYQFGDSLSDTGNLVQIVGSRAPSANLPYGQTFGRPTGRSSDGLLMVDYFAMYFNLPLLNPFLANGSDFTHGANFAVASGTALDAAALATKNISLRLLNVSLVSQLGWFQTHVHSICSSPSDCIKVLKNSLVMVGEIGGNDYNNALMQGKPLSVAYELIPEVVNTIKQSVEEIIELGAVNIVIPGGFGLGCLPAYLATFATNDSSKYDDLMCLKDYNALIRSHNKEIRRIIQTLKSDHPDVAIAYADFYSALTWILQNAASLGFEQDARLVACCGTGNNEYNYDPTRPCGSPGVPVCPDPSKRVQWDGIHLTQQAYKLMSKFLLKQFLPGLGLVYV